MLRDPLTHFVVIEAANGSFVATGYVQVRASLAYRRHAKHGYCGMMFTALAQRGLGLNRLVMDALVAWGRAEHALGQFYLEVYTSNAKAVRAYEKAGFAPLITEMLYDGDCGQQHRL